MSLREDAARQLLIEGQDALDAGKVNQARTLLKKSLEKSPSFDAAFLTALTYGQQNNLKMAASYFRQATKIDPSIVEGHFNLAYALHQADDFTGARDAYQAALKIKPDYFQALINLSSVLEELKDLDEAIRLLEQAITLKPDEATCHYNLGSALMTAGRHEDALKSFDRVLEITPAHKDALFNRGLTYLALQRNREALDDFGRTLAIDPNDGDCYYQKGLAAQRLRFSDIAADAFVKASEFQPDNADAFLNGGNALEATKKYDKALQFYEKARKLKPDIPFIDGMLHSVRLHACDWADYDKRVQTILSDIDAGRRIILPHGTLLINATREQRKKASEIWADLYFSAIQEKPFEDQPEPPADRKIRIGYFSADFHMHPVSMLAVRMFELHDRSQFEIFAFSMGLPSRDPLRLRVESSVDHFINIREMNDFEVINFTREHGLDIAVDMTGYTADGRPAIFALRAAPIQINYLGFSGTMGAKFMDYIIGDPVLIPPEHDEGYTEKVIRLPDTYMPSDPTRTISSASAVRAAHGLPETGFVFCGFNNPNKLCPPHFDIWMRILIAVPDSVIWMSSASAMTQDNLRKEAKQRGVDPARLIFASRVPDWADHLARHAAADLFLDTLPHNAHATANDALWGGLPVLTALGESYAGRVGSSLSCAAGMNELVTRDLVEYERLAIEIAQTPGRSRALKDKLAQNLKTAPIFDVERYTRNIEKAFRTLLDHQRQGLPAQSLDIE
jgi:predicted O-linked N-acetylglucosamine transferase (SPINDLY family)